MMPSTDHESTQAALVLVLHGLGMCPKEFQLAISDCLGSSMPWVHLSVPEAPRKQVTYLDGQPKLRRWFDIESAPVLPFEVHEDLWDSVAFVHELVRKAETAGISSNRIVLAGFSQGAVTALAAGLTYEHPLAGICSFSGWLPEGLVEQVRHLETPISMSHGEQDTLIPVNTGLESAWALKEAGYTKLKFQRYSEFGHSFGHSEQLESLKAFVISKLAPQKASSFSDTMSTNIGSDSSDDELSSLDEDAYSNGRRNSLVSSCETPTHADMPLRDSIQTSSSCLTSTSPMLEGSLYTVGKRIEVLRTSGAWTAAKITAIQSSILTVELEDGTGQKQVSADFAVARPVSHAQLSPVRKGQGPAPGTCRQGPVVIAARAVPSSVSLATPVKKSVSSPSVAHLKVPSHQSPKSLSANVKVAANGCPTDQCTNVALNNTLAHGTHALLRPRRFTM